MKKIILILASVPLIVTSCMKGTNYEGSFYFTDTGIYNNSSEIFQNGATVFLFPARRTAAGKAYLPWAIR